VLPLVAVPCLRGREDPLKNPPLDAFGETVPQTLNAKIGGSAPILSVDSYYPYLRTPDGRLNELIELAFPQPTLVFEPDD